jgi:hypothetical protein
MVVRPAWPTVCSKIGRALAPTLLQKRWRVRRDGPIGPASAYAVRAYRTVGLAIKRMSGSSACTELDIEPTSPNESAPSWTQPILVRAAPIHCRACNSFRGSTKRRGEQPKGKKEAPPGTAFLLHLW